MTKSVLIIAKHLIYGGREKYTLNLANEFAEKGIKVTLISGEGPLTQYVSPKINLHVMPIARTSALKKITEQKIFEIAQKVNPQIIHTQCRTSMINAQLARHSLGIPLVTHEHHMYEDPKDYPSIVDELINGADEVITVGPYAARTLIKYGYPKDRVVTVLNGVDTKNVKVITRKEAILAREELGISPTDKVAVCISRLEPGKGIDKLARAFIKVTKEIPEAKLMIIGEDRTHETDLYVNKIIKANNLEGKLIRVPGTYDIKKYHAVADVFCYPALGKGMAVMEAMAAGLPIIGKKTTRKPLMMEDGISGLMTAPTPHYKIDPDQISEKLIFLLNHPDIARKMGKAARRRIEKEFTIERVIKQTLSVYEDVINDYQSSIVSPADYDVLPFIPATL